MTDNLTTRKRETRLVIKAALASMTDEQRHEESANACARLVELDVFQRASVVMMYMPLAGEVDVTPIALRCFRDSKTACVPKVDWKRREMDAVEVTSLDDHVLDTDEHGLRVPRESRPVLSSIIDLVMVPGLAFDLQGRRLGRGGGYYDRFLSRLKRSALSVGIGFDRQIVESVPVGEDDSAVSILVTDRRVVHVRHRAGGSSGR